MQPASIGSPRTTGLALTVTLLAVEGLQTLAQPQEVGPNTAVGSTLPAPVDGLVLP